MIAKTVVMDQLMVIVKAVLIGQPILSAKAVMSDQHMTIETFALVVFFVRWMIIKLVSTLHLLLTLLCLEIHQTNS